MIFILKNHNFCLISYFNSQKGFLLPFPSILPSSLTWSLPTWSAELKLSALKKKNWRLLFPCGKQFPCYQYLLTHKLWQKWVKITKVGHYHLGQLTILIPLLFTWAIKPFQIEVLRWAFHIKIYLSISKLSKLGCHCTPRLNPF